MVASVKLLYKILASALTMTDCDHYNITSAQKVYPP